MHTNEKIDFFACTDLKHLPAVKSHVVECPQCRYRIPVPVEYGDWREIAERYRRAHEKMATAFFEELKEAGEQSDAPLVEYFEASRQTMLADLQQILDQQKPSP